MFITAGQFIWHIVDITKHADSTDDSTALVFPRGNATQTKATEILDSIDSNISTTVVPFSADETKNQWARDDPGFVVILSFFLVSAIAWGLVYGHGLVGILKMSLFMVFIDFVVVGMVIST
ncbi:4152_t:CDS:2, partial [Acaulospora morrowiae]